MYKFTGEELIAYLTVRQLRSFLDDLQDDDEISVIKSKNPLVSALSVSTVDRRYIGRIDFNMTDYVPTWVPRG